MGARKRSKKWRDSSIKADQQADAVVPLELDAFYIENPTVLRQSGNRRFSSRISTIVPVPVPSKDPVSRATRSSSLKRSNSVGGREETARTGDVKYGNNGLANVSLIQLYTGNEDTAMLETPEEGIRGRANNMQQTEQTRRTRSDSRKDEVVIVGEVQNTPDPVVIILTPKVVAPQKQSAHVTSVVSDSVRKRSSVRVEGKVSATKRNMKRITRTSALQAVEPSIFLRNRRTLMRSTIPRKGSIQRATRSLRTSSSSAIRRLGGRRAVTIGASDQSNPRGCSVDGNEGVMGMEVDAENNYKAVEEATDKVFRRRASHVLQPEEVRLTRNSAKITGTVGTVLTPLLSNLTRSPVSEQKRTPALSTARNTSFRKTRSAKVATTLAADRITDPVAEARVPKTAARYPGSTSKSPTPQSFRSSRKRKIGDSKVEPASLILADESASKTHDKTNIDTKSQSKLYFEGIRLNDRALRNPKRRLRSVEVSASQISAAAAGGISNRMMPSTSASKETVLNIVPLARKSRRFVSNAVMQQEAKSVEMVPISDTVHRVTKNKKTRRSHSAMKMQESDSQAKIRKSNRRSKLVEVGGEVVETFVPRQLRSAVVSGTQNTLAPASAPLVSTESKNLTNRDVSPNVHFSEEPVEVTLSVTNVAQAGIPCNAKSIIDGDSCEIPNISEQSEADLKEVIIKTTSGENEALTGVITENLQEYGGNVQHASRSSSSNNETLPIEISTENSSMMPEESLILTIDKQPSDKTHADRYTPGKELNNSELPIQPLQNDFEDTLAVSVLQTNQQIRSAHTNKDTVTSDSTELQPTNTLMKLDKAGLSPLIPQRFLTDGSLLKEQQKEAAEIPDSAVLKSTQVVSSSESANAKNQTALHVCHETDIISTDNNPKVVSPHPSNSAAVIIDVENLKTSPSSPAVSYQDLIPETGDTDAMELEDQETQNVESIPEREDKTPLPDNEDEPAAISTVITQISETNGKSVSVFHESLSKEPLPTSNSNSKVQASQNNNKIRDSVLGISETYHSFSSQDFGSPSIFDQFLDSSYEENQCEIEPIFELSFEPDKPDESEKRKTWNNFVVDLSESDTDVSNDDTDVSNDAGEPESNAPSERDMLPGALGKSEDSNQVSSRTQSCNTGFEDIPSSNSEAGVTTSSIINADVAINGCSPILMSTVGTMEQMQSNINVEVTASLSFGLQRKPEISRYIASATVPESTNISKPAIRKTDVEGEFWNRSENVLSGGVLADIADRMNIPANSRAEAELPMGDITSDGISIATGASQGSTLHFDANEQLLWENFGQTIDYVLDSDSNGTTDDEITVHVLHAGDRGNVSGKPQNEHYFGQDTASKESLKESNNPVIPSSDNNVGLNNSSSKCERNPTFYACPISELTWMKVPSDTDAMVPDIPAERQSPRGTKVASMIESTPVPALRKQLESKVIFQKPEVNVPETSNVTAPVAGPSWFIPLPHARDCSQLNQNEVKQAKASEVIVPEVDKRAEPSTAEKETLLNILDEQTQAAVYEVIAGWTLKKSLGLLREDDPADADALRFFRAIYPRNGKR